MRKAGAPKTDAMSGIMALSPVIVFLGIYLAVSLSAGDFYSMPIAVALVFAAVWSVVVSREGNLRQRVEIFSRSAAHSDILYMIWIFILAGAFAAVAKGTGAVEATVALALQLFPSWLILPAIFTASCLVSLAIGTSVGTVVAVTPLAVEIARNMDGGSGVPLMVAVVLGGAFFGDNLSFISDTTIAATRTQGCRMADKFRANVMIVLPAALLTLALYVLIGADGGSAAVNAAADGVAPWWLTLPYLLIILLAVSGVNVLTVLTTGIAAALCTGVIRGMDLTAMFRLMGDGIAGMGDLIVITLLSAGIVGMIKAAGGFSFLLHVMTRSIRGSRGAQACIAALAGAVDLCTANNTVAIITVGELAADISHRYGVAPRKSASLLDTASCIAQCLIPYGAQTLMATALAGISPAAPWPYLYYPWMLAGCTLVSIIIVRRHNRATSPAQ